MPSRAQPVCWEPTPGDDGDDEDDDDEDDGAAAAEVGESSANPRFLNSSGAMRLLFKGRSSALAVSPSGTACAGSKRSQRERQVPTYWSIRHFR